MKQKSTSQHPLLQREGLLTVNAQVAQTLPPPGPTVAELGAAAAGFTAFAVRRQTSESTITPSSTATVPVESSDPNYNPIYLTTSQPHTEVEFTITGGQLYLAPALLGFGCDESESTSGQTEIRFKLKSKCRCQYANRNCYKPDCVRQGQFWNRDTYGADPRQFGR